MRVFFVDERDSAWELSTPRFRVYLHGSGADSTCGGTATYDVVGADVLQVIDRAQRQASDRATYAVALVCDDAEREGLIPGFGRGLVWLVGRDGNDIPHDDPVLEQAEQRILRRRSDPLRIPEGDRAPDEIDAGDLPAS